MNLLPLLCIHLKIDFGKDLRAEAKSQPSSIKTHLSSPKVTNFFPQSFSQPKYSHAR